MQKTETEPPKGDELKDAKLDLKEAKPEIEARTAHLPAEAKEDGQQAIDEADRKQRAIEEFEKREAIRKATGLAPCEPGEHRLIISSTGAVLYQNFDGVEQILGFIDLQVNPQSFKETIVTELRAQMQEKALEQRKRRK